MTLRVCESLDFDGSTNYLKKLSAGIADSKKGTIAGCFRIDGGANTLRRILLDDGGGAANLSFRLGDDNKFRVVGDNTSNTPILDLQSSHTYSVGAAWHRILISWDLAIAGARHMYIDDVSDLVANVFTNDTIDFGANWAVGASVAGNSKYHGCMAELYWKAGQYYDFSQTSVRRMFFDFDAGSVLRPVGWTGNVVTPDIGMVINDGGAAGDFDDNSLGSCGAFTPFGTLSLGSTSPSD